MEKRIVILGAGESGCGAAVLAQKLGFDVFVSDFGAITDKYKEMLDSYGIRWEEKKHSEETLKTYISWLYYDLLDSIENEYDNFGIPTELDSIQAVEYVEGEIEKMIRNYYKGV